MGISLQKGDIVFLDTAPLIYFFEEHPDYFALMAELFEHVYTTNAQVITSIITYIELTTQPVKSGNLQLARKYRDYLTFAENITLFPLDLTIADQVVNLRAKYHLKTPDAIQLGTALASGADYVVTNDQGWKKAEELKVLLMEDLAT